MKKELLIKAAKELDELLYDPSQIDSEQAPDKLQVAMKEASKELEADDKLTEETIDILAQIWEGKEGKLTVKVCEIFRELGILPPADEKEEQEEDAVVVSAGEDLVNEIDDAERIKDLKDIAKSNDEFKLIRGKLNGYKEIDDLRDVMLGILDGAAPAEKESEEEPKAEKKVEPKSPLKIVPKDEETDTIERHSLNILPAIRGSDYARLYNELEENGYDEKFPIYLYEGKILDGQQRYGICKKLEIEPVFKDFEGTKIEAIQFVLRTNKRRNLTSSQWAAIASEATEILNELTEEAKERQREHGKTAPGKKKNTSNTNIISEEKSTVVGKAAKIFNTNPAYIQEAKKIKEESPEDFEAIKSGEKTISQIRMQNKPDKKEDPFFHDTARLVEKTFNNLEKIVQKKRAPKTKKDFSDMEKIKVSLSEMIELFDSLGI